MMEMDMSNSFLDKKAVIEEGDMVVVYVNMSSSYAVQVTRGQTLQTKYGAVRHEYMIDKHYGTKVTATKGYVHLLRPTPELWCRTLEHRTQILYPADVALATLYMDVLFSLKPGKVILEAGTGSGAASHAFARAVAPSGHLYTFDVDPKRVAAAKKDFERNKFEKFVTVSERDACEQGFGMDDVADAVFLDMPCPWNALIHVTNAFKKHTDGKLVSFSPCIEQVTRTCDEMRRLGFVRIEMVEIVPRKLKVVPSRMDVLVARKVGVRRAGSPQSSEEAGPPKSKRARCEEGEGGQGNCIAIAHPAQQPTHTGYITVATYPAKILP